MIRPLAAALAVALAAPAAAAAPPRTAALDAAGARVYVRADAGVALAGIALRVRAGLDRQTGTQNGLAALVAETVLRTPVEPASGSGPAVALADAVGALGGSIDFQIGPQHAGYFLEGTPDAIAATAPLVARALAAPSFDAATLASARAALGERIAAAQDQAELVGVEMLRSSYYRGAAGLPPLGNPGALAAFTPADAQAFFRRWYLRGDAVVAAVGRTGAATDAASRALAAALPAGSTPPAAALETRPFGVAPKRIVTQRDIGAPVVVLGFAAPALGERDFPAALVIRALFGGIFTHVGASTLPPAFRSAGIVYGYETAPAQLAVWLDGALADPATGLAALAVLVKDAAAKPLAPAVLTRYKETARGEWALEALSLDERAWAIDNAVARGLDPDAADGVGAAIERVTAADVQRVAKKYFQKFDVALVVPRGGGS